MSNEKNRFSITAPVDRVDVFRTKNDKDIITVVLAIAGQYPQLVPVKVFGQLANGAASWTKGAVLEITGRLGGREWNGKVYGENVAESVEVVAAGKQQELPAGNPDDDDVAF